MAGAQSQWDDDNIARTTTRTAGRYETRSGGGVDGDSGPLFFFLLLLLSALFYATRTSSLLTARLGVAPPKHFRRNIWTTEEYSIEPMHDPDHATGNDRGER